jgi:hypothetical protein
MSLTADCSRKDKIASKRRAAAKIQLLKLSLVIQELGLNISHKASPSAAVKPLLDIHVHQLQAEVLQRTFDMQLSAGMSGFGMAVHAGDASDYVVYTQPRLCLLQDAPGSDVVANWVKQSQGDERFVTLHMSLSDVTNPLLDKEFDATLCTMVVNVRLVALALQQEPLVQLIKTTLPLLSAMERDIAQLDFGTAATGDEVAGTSAIAAASPTVIVPTRKKPYLDLKLTATLAGVELSLGQEGKRLLVFGLDKVTTTVEQSKELVCQ